MTEEKIIDQYFQTNIHSTKIRPTLKVPISLRYKATFNKWRRRKKNDNISSQDNDQDRRT